MEVEAAVVVKAACRLGLVAVASRRLAERMDDPAGQVRIAADRAPIRVEIWESGGWERAEASHACADALLILLCVLCCDVGRVDRRLPSQARVAVPHRFCRGVQRNTANLKYLHQCINFREKIE